MIRFKIFADLDSSDTREEVKDVGYMSIEEVFTLQVIILHELQPFRRQMEHFLTNMNNRVEHQKLNQVTAELPPV